MAPALSPMLKDPLYDELGGWAGWTYIALGLVGVMVFVVLALAAYGFALAWEWLFHG